MSKYQDKIAVQAVQASRLSNPFLSVRLYYAC